MQGTRASVASLPIRFPRNLPQPDRIEPCLRRQLPAWDGMVASWPGNSSCAYQGTYTEEQRRTRRPTVRDVHATGHPRMSPPPATPAPSWAGRPARRGGQGGPCARRPSAEPNSECVHARIMCAYRCASIFSNQPPKALAGNALARSLLTRFRHVTPACIQAAGKKAEPKRMAITRRRKKGGEQSTNTNTQSMRWTM